MAGVDRLAVEETPRPCSPGRSVPAYWGVSTGPAAGAGARAARRPPSWARPPECSAHLPAPAAEPPAPPVRARACSARAPACSARASANARDARALPPGAERQPPGLGRHVLELARERPGLRRTVAFLLLLVLLRAEDLLEPLAQA